MRRPWRVECAFLFQIDTSSGNTIGDICPAGWRLPTGTSPNEFLLLSNSLGGQNKQSMSGSTTPSVTIMSKRFRHFPNNLLYSGYIALSYSFPGSYGYYWSSTAYNNNSTYYLSLEPSYIYLGNYFTNSNKYFGKTLRCIAISS